MVALPSRNEIAAEHTWNAPSLFESRDAWRVDLQALVGDIPQLQDYQGKLGESPETLLTFISLREDLFKRVMKLYVYTSLASNVDTNDQEAAGMEGQVQGAFGQMLGAGAFAEPELLSIGLETLEGWMDQNDDLQVYAHYIEDLYRQQKHVRSSEVEQVLGLLMEPFSAIESIASALTNAELEFPPAVSSTGEELPLAQSTIGALLTNPDREVRRSAWETYADRYLSKKQTLASTYLASVKADVYNMRVRGYESTLDAALFGNNVPTDVFHNLINTFRENIPTWHKYWRVRKQALGVETLQPYDIWSPLTDKEFKITYDQAVDHISQGMQPLGDYYVNVLRQGCLEDRWVDRYPNEGKRQGAFSSGSKGTFPFIMMSYTDDISSLSTLAHELGHSMHSYLTWENQPMVYGNYSMFVAEVASNFNQALVRAHLLDNTDDPYLQIQIIEEAMDNFHRYFFIMPTLARFEYEIHQRVEHGKPVTPEDMINLMADLYAEGYGDDMHLDRDRTGITWAQFSHLYVNYYTFQYSTGISAAHALANDVLSGSPTASDNYLSFLKAGSSLYPIDALKVAGIDMQTPEAVEKAFVVLNDYVDRLDQLVKSIQ